MSASDGNEINLDNVHKLSLFDLRQELERRAAWNEGDVVDISLRNFLIERY